MAAENAGIVALVTAYPRHLDAVAAITGMLSGLKFGAYAATALAIAVLSVARLSGVLRRAEGTTGSAKSRSAAADE